MHAMQFSILVASVVCSNVATINHVDTAEVGRTSSTPALLREASKVASSVGPSSQTVTSGSDQRVRDTFSTRTRTSTRGHRRRQPFGSGWLRGNKEQGYTQSS